MSRGREIGDYLDDLLKVATERLPELKPLITELVGK